MKKIIRFVVITFVAIFGWQGVAKEKQIQLTKKKLS